MKASKRVSAFAALLMLLAWAAPVWAETDTDAAYNLPSLNITMIKDEEGATALLRDIVDMAGGYIAPQPVWNQGSTARFPSMVLGIVTPEFSGTVSLGRKPDGNVPTPYDIYPLSSISKMLTGLMVAQGVVNNDFAPDTPIRKLLKEDLGSLVGERTVGQVISHFAGYSRRPTNVHIKQFPYSPGKNYSREELIVCLKDVACSQAPTPIGSTYIYSDTGLGLMGLALSDFYGKSYEQLLTEKITQPLGMADTHLRSAVSDEGRFFTGIAPDGASVPPATMGALAGAGEVVSTGHDMVILLKALLNPPVPLKPVIKLAATPITEGARIGYAIDVVESRAGYSIDITPPGGAQITMRSKAGEQFGFSSLIMWSPELQSGAVALVNAGMSAKPLAQLLIGIMRQIRDHQALQK